MSCVGDVIWFCPKKGYGFITYENDGKKQKDLFVHFSDLNVEGFKTLNKGQRVEFSLGKNNHGDPKAIEVKVIS